ncbi:MAG: hypothetical protein MZV63_11060 [Marinilabiliales bacterium]|nr:hypothetical protein [Marinilabiliales bacterium]
MTTKSSMRINYLKSNYSVSELNITGIDNESGSFYKVSIPGHYNSVKTGKPELPLYSRLIQIPKGSDYKIRISDVKKSKIRPGTKGYKGLVYPAQESLSKSVQQDREKQKFIIDRTVYNSEDYITSDTVWIENLGILRNQDSGKCFYIPCKV